jgi:hypothetical protein
MPTKMTTKEIKDIAQERVIARDGAFHMERQLAALAPNTPEYDKQLQELDAQRAKLKAYDEALEGTAEQVRAELAGIIDQVFTAREALAWLAGWHGDRLTDSVFTYCYLNPGDTIRAHQVRDALLRELEPAPAREPTQQELDFEERHRNERAGKGFYTNEELERVTHDPYSFHGGAGATKPVRVPIDPDAWGSTGRRR